MLSVFGAGRQYNGTLVFGWDGRYSAVSRVTMQTRVTYLVLGLVDRVHVIARGGHNIFGFRLRIGLLINDKRVSAQ